MNLKKIGFHFGGNNLLLVKGKEEVENFIRFINPHKTHKLGKKYTLILNKKTMTFEQGVKNFKISKKIYRNLLYQLGKSRIEDKKKIIFKI